MNGPRERTQAIGVALAARLTRDQLEEIAEDLDARWCDSGGLIGAGSPSGADVILFALHDALADDAAAEGGPVAPDAFDATRDALAELATVKAERDVAVESIEPFGECQSDCDCGGHQGPRSCGCHVTGEEARRWICDLEIQLAASEAREAAATRVVDAVRAARPTLAYLAGGGRRLSGQLTDLIAAIDALGALPAAEEPIDQWRMADWLSLPDQCLIAACEGTDIDQRGPVWLRDGRVAKACVEHWEGVFRVLGDQATWEKTDGAVVSAPLIGAEEPVSPQPDVKIFGAAPEPPLPQDIPRHSLSLNGRTDEPDEPKWGVEFAVLDGGVHHAYGDQSWVAYGGAIRDEHPNGKVQCRRISISYGPWQDWPAAVPAPLIGAAAPGFPQAAGNDSGEVA